MAFVALRTDVPILPVAISGMAALNENLKKRRRTDARARVGYPFYLRAGSQRARKETLTAMMREAMYQLAALLPPEQRGVYADVAQATEQYIEPLEPGQSNLKFVDQPGASTGSVARPRFVGATR